MPAPIPHTSPLFTAIATAARVTVIPIADDGLITVEHAPDGGRPWCGFPSAVKAHPRVRNQTAVQRLLGRDLGCEYTDLRLVAIFDPEPGHRQREAVYITEVHWPQRRPRHAGITRHRLISVTTRAQATEVGLRPGRVEALLAGDDLPAAARALPNWAPREPDLATSAAPFAPVDSTARRFR